MSLLFNQIFQKKDCCFCGEPMAYFVNDLSTSYLLKYKNLLFIKPIKNEVISLTTKIGMDKKRVWKRKHNIFQQCSIEMNTNKLNIFIDHNNPEKLKSSNLHLMYACENCRRLKYSLVEFELKNGYYVIPDDYIEYEVFIIWIKNREIIVERNQSQDYTKIGKKVYKYIKNGYFDFENLEKLQKQVENLLILG